ncbi:NAD-dependent epimerase/dehydratase family protein [uncultured Winogradskyella sp.]|uniref:NAD-dependent epimerase/dehydratase family protein n=1 Tax=uncultured Winogradskyella sp. TaxID=395353 RepID=UPI00260A2DAE|nr:NAD-dependent epimerase/dehydratase family protein [uncultured Winogradskyella sp.]
MKAKHTRREFISKTTLATIGIPLLGSTLLSCIEENKTQTEVSNLTDKKLKILILGGTSYLGPHQVAYAIGRGHSVSIFTRGKTKPKLHKEAFKKVEHLIGDREDNLTALENRKWDVVIDNSGRKVQWAKDTANLLKDNVGMYMYTSSTGVYYPYLNNSISTKTPLVLSLPTGITDDEKYEHEYGIMKANSELEAMKVFGKDRFVAIRPTYMLGPGDRTDRFLHWPLRLSKGGEILVPGKKEDLVQYVDVRDVAEWFIRLAENNQAGTYNGVGPKAEQTMLDFVKEASKAFDKSYSFTLVDDYDFLKENNIYYQIPWVMPDEKHYGSARIQNTNAINNGLTFRPLKDTIIDTYNWWNSNIIDLERKEKYETNKNALIAKEKELLTQWSQLVKG